MTAPLLFIDTETTGLGEHDEIWEVAGIYRPAPGIEQSFVFQVQHDRDLCAALPTAFRADHRARFDHNSALSRSGAIAEIYKYIPVSGGKVHLVAANPAFDARFLTKLMGGSPWHYHLIDVEAVALGWLHARIGAEPFRGSGPSKSATDRLALASPPWKSDELSRLCGVEPPNRQERHTAQGDVEWVKRWFDAMVG